MIDPLIASVVAAQETPFILFGCALFAAALFVYVFYQPGEVETGEAKTRYGYLQERKEATYENLRDLNFEYKAGKLSEKDTPCSARRWKMKRPPSSPKWRQSRRPGCASRSRRADGA